MLHRDTKELTTRGPFLIWESVTYIVIEKRNIKLLYKLRYYSIYTNSFHLG